MWRRGTHEQLVLMSRLLPATIKSFSMWRKARMSSAGWSLLHCDNCCSKLWGQSLLYPNAAEETHSFVKTMKNNTLNRLIWQTSRQEVLVSVSWFTVVIFLDAQFRDCRVETRNVFSATGRNQARLTVPFEVKKPVKSTQCFFVGGIRNRTVFHFKHVTLERKLSIRSILLMHPALQTTCHHITDFYG